MTTPRKTTPRKRRILLNILLGLVLVLLLLILALIGTPSFYQNAEDRDMAMLSQNAKTFCSKAQDFASEILSKLPSVIELSENNVNGCLAAANDDELWAELPVNIASIRKAMSSQSIRNPQISLKDGKAVLAGETTVAGLNVVVSATVIPRVLPGGGLSIEIASVYAGWLPLPKSFITGRIKQVEDGKIIVTKPKTWRITSLEVTKGKLKMMGEPD